MYDFDPLADKNVLVTGGTGSIGEAITQEIVLYHEPRSVRIYSRSEYEQYLLKERFERIDIDTSKMRFLIGDVREKERLDLAMMGVNVVFHAAAMKRVESCEYNPFEATKTNVMGTQNVINSALHENADMVIAISSDKAVDPINVMGTTKLLAEKLILQADYYKGHAQTKFGVVRIGNVWGSRGSVLPSFLQQAKKGKIEVRHREATRFCITKKSVAQFVLKVAESMETSSVKGVFIPYMKAFRVYDLAVVVANEAINETSIEITSLGYGEKIHEVLTGANETYSGFFVQSSKGVNYIVTREKGDYETQRSSKDASFLTTEDLTKIVEDYIFENEGEYIEKVNT